MASQAVAAGLLEDVARLLDAVEFALQAGDLVSLDGIGVEQGLGPTGRRGRLADLTRKDDDDPRRQEHAEEHRQPSSRDADDRQAGQVGLGRFDAEDVRGS